MTDADCLFCKIVERRLPAEITYEDHSVIAFKDIHPQAPVHILLVPRVHLSGLVDLSTGHEDVAGAVMVSAARVAERLGLAGSGYRLVVNQGRDGGQTVGHLHVHLLGGRSMTWPPG